MHAEPGKVSINWTGDQLKLIEAVLEIELSRSQDYYAEFVEDNDDDPEESKVALEEWVDSVEALTTFIQAEIKAKGIR